MIILFVNRNPCKHPIVVLKDVNFKYMKLLMMYMYRGEVSCPTEDLYGLLKTARLLQIRGLSELDKKREIESNLCTTNGSPLKQSASPRRDNNHMSLMNPAAHDQLLRRSGSNDSGDVMDEETRARLHSRGLEVQPLMAPSSTGSTYQVS